MSEQQWAKHALLDPAHAQRVAPDEIKVEPPPDAARAVSPPVPDQPLDDASAAAQLSMALYLLQALHVEGKPGYAHLQCDDSKRPGEDDEEDPDAEPLS
jgi:hypothetical protein